MPRLRHADHGLPAWSAWRSASARDELTIGIEEEFMLLDPHDWSLAFRAEEVIADLPVGLRHRVTLETHAAVMEIATGVHRRVRDAISEVAELRRLLSPALARHGLRAGVAGTHPSARWDDTVLCSQPRYRQIGESMRVLARREPTLALHVHVGVATPQAAVRVLNGLRARLPLLLALSANSPFWQGRATGFASTRTTLFDAFPRSGVPRTFPSYSDWVAAVESLLRTGAIPDPSYLWWDVRLQPRYGTVEVRVMDAQTTVADVAALAALVQSLACLELERPDAEEHEPAAIEVIEENRFLAARDGMEALLITAGSGRRIPAIALLERLVVACGGPAERLGCGRELATLHSLAAGNGAARQLSRAAGGDPRDVAAGLADAYLPDRPPAVAHVPEPVRPAARGAALVPYALWREWLPSAPRMPGELRR
jgi:glutamate---cysteine ligase / carboxylate-amine ligase